MLLPIAAVVAASLEGGLAAFWEEVTSPPAIAALKLTFVISLLVVLANAVTGMLIAWVLVRDFRGKSVVNALIDLPFALPTIVAGLTLLAIYGPKSPVGVNVAYTRTAIALALLFVTLPFVVRAVQPVLMELDREMEQAAASSASPSHDLPENHPAQPHAGGALRGCTLVRQGRGRIRLDRPHLGEHPLHRGGLGAHLQGDRERRPGDRGGVSVVLLLLSLLVLIGPTSSNAGAGGTMRRVPLSRYGLRLAALGYLAAIIVLPTSMILRKAFQNGVRPVMDACRPRVRARAKAHAGCCSHRRAREHNLRCRLRNGARSRNVKRGAWFFNSAIGLPLALSPVVVGLSLILVYGNDGWLGAQARGQRDPDHLLDARNRPRDGLRHAAVRRPRGRAGLTRGGDRPGRGIVDARRLALADLLANHAAGHSLGVAYGVVLTTARALGEYGAVAVVSAASRGRRTL